MDPNFQNNQAPQGNPYEFIMNPQQPVRRNPFGGSFMMKIVLIVGIGGMLMLILGIFAVSKGGSGGNSNEVMLGLAQQQTEIQRVSSTGTTTIRKQAVKNFGQTTAMTFSSDRLQLLQLLAKRGYKVQSKQLGLKKNPVTDQKLTTAQNASEYDDTYVAVLQEELKDYQAVLQATYKTSKSATEKKLLTDLYNHAALLLQQSAIQG